MYKKSSKKRQRVRLFIVYSVMTLTVLLMASILILFLLGFRIDRDNGRIEQGGLLQFASTPSGAAVEIDGKMINSSTPTKLTAFPGSHSIKMYKNQYEVWSKEISISAGALYWLDYARLVPNNRPIQNVKTYSALHNNIYSTDRKYCLVQQNPTDTSFELLDLRNDNVTSKLVSLPETAISSLKQPKMSGYAIYLMSWDKGNRYVLLKVESPNAKEWIVLDTRNPEESKNISLSLSVGLDQVSFSGTSGKIFYALSSGELRKLDLDSGTISRSYYSNVSSFEMFNSSTLSFEATKSDASGNYKLVGIFRDGDQSPHIIRQVDSSVGRLKIALGQYANRDYVAVLESNKVSILRGSFPPSDSLTNDSLENFAQFNVTDGSSYIKFSPGGDYLTVSSTTDISTFEIEHQKNYNFKSELSGLDKITWLDDNYIYGYNADQLFIQEFDGSNFTKLNTALKNYPAALSHNQVYIYSTGKIDSGYSINRIKMILD